MKTLIAFFSWSGNTKKLATKIAKEKRCDLMQITRNIPYSTDYNTCAYVEAKNERERNIHPKINAIPLNIPNTLDIKEYDTILLFFPIWWYTFPMPIATFIESIKGYKGEVFVFANSYTDDPQYISNAMRDLKAIAPSVGFKEGLLNKNFTEHIDFIDRI